MKQRSINKILQIVFLVFLCTLPLSWLSAWPVDVLPLGSYPIASSNFEASPPEFGTIEQYMKGAYINGQSRYIDSLLVNPEAALSILVDVPDISSLYGVYSGTQVPVSGYIIYPTTEDNDREDYTFPYTNTGDNVFPRMEMPGDEVIPADPKRKYPLIIFSHGYNSHGLWDLVHMKYLASHGYVVVSIFHGDNRIRSVTYQFRALAVKAFLDHLLESTPYASLIDESRIGISGASLGGNTVLALLGGGYVNHPECVIDPRFKAGFGIVPAVGNPNNSTFLPEYTTLRNVEVPFMAVMGELDLIVPVRNVLASLEQTSGITLAFTFMGEEHLFTEIAWQEVQTLEVLFFDSYLKNSTVAEQLLLGDVYVSGEVENLKVIQRLSTETE